MIEIMEALDALNDAALRLCQDVDGQALRGGPVTLDAALLGQYRAARDHLEAVAPGIDS